MDEYVAEELRESRDALSDAHFLHQGTGTDKAVVNRLYYACFHAVNAVLHERGFDPTTHQAVLRLLGKEIVMNDDATREDGRFYNDLRTYRQIADYEHTPVDADVDELVDQAETFVDKMESVV